MKEAEVTEYIRELLAKDDALENMWAYPPDAGFIPMNKERSRFYLIVNFFLKNEFDNQKSLEYVCSSSLRLIHSTDILSGLGAVEFVPCLMNGNKTKRILRFSVACDSVNKAIKMTGTSLLENRKKPIDGIYCGWY